MRTRRILVVALALLATGMTAGMAAEPVANATAEAGGWEETVLDPTPDWIESGRTYTFGYWILRHGSYPLPNPNGEPTALRATDENGTVVDFPGTRLATEGHYSAEAVFPHDGVWTIGSQHELLMPDSNVAAVTVPGRVAVSASEVAERAPYEWGPVRPEFPPSEPGGARLAAPTPQEGPLTAEQVSARTTAEEPGTELPMWLVVLGGAATVGFALWLARRHTRANHWQAPGR